MLPCHVLYGVGHCLERTQSYVQTPSSPMATLHSSGSGCTDAGSWHHPPRPAHSSPHGGLHPIPWLTGHNFYHQAGRRHQSASPLPTAHPDPTVTVVWGGPASPMKIQCLHCLRSHTLCLLPPHWAASPVLQSEPRTSGFTPRIICGGQKPSPNGSNWHPPSKSADHLHSQTRNRDKAVRLTIRSSWRSSHGVEIFIEPPRFLWCGRPVSRLRHQILLMHPWDTPSILATSRWVLPSAGNRTIRCNICCGKFCGRIPFKSSKKYQ